MKNIILALALTYFYQIASTCGTGDCISCTTWRECSDVADNECSWNYNANQCATAPNPCSALNNLPDACKNEATCGKYDYSNNTCHKTAKTYTSACSDFGGFAVDCRAKRDGGSFSNGCRFDYDTSTCNDIPADFVCSTDGAADQDTCEDQYGCYWNFSSNTCVSDDTFPSFDCDLYDFVPTGCNCYYNTITGDCQKPLPTYNTNCASLNGFEYQCKFAQACTWKTDDKNCVEVTPYSASCAASYNLKPYSCERDTTNCGYFNYYSNFCKEGNTPPAYDSNCASLNGYKDQCNGVSKSSGDNGKGCYYLEKSHICVATKDCSTAGDSKSTCEQYYGNVEYGDENIGCSWNTDSNSCTHTPTYNGCDVYNNLPRICDGHSLCYRNTFDDTCHRGSPSSSITSSCSELNGWESQCDDIDSGGSNGNGCSFNFNDKTCVDTPLYSFSCSSYNNFPLICEADTDNCGLYNYRTNNCEPTSSAPSVTPGSVTCSDLNGYRYICDEVGSLSGNGANDQGCSFNWSNNLCDDTRVYSNDCTIFNNQEASCLAAGSSDCLYNKSANSCTKDTCKNKSASDGNCGDCIVENDCNDLLSNGCSWNSVSDMCELIPSFREYCSLLNNFEYACKQKSECVFDTVCKPVPTCSDATSSTCSLCNSDSDACQKVSGCTFNFLDSECTTPPTYNTNCASLRGYPTECIANSNCTVYNRNTNACEESAPSVTQGSVTCSALSYYEDACNNVNAASGNGANNLGCAYNISSNNCVAITAFDSSSDSCSDLQYLGKICSAQTNVCLYNQKNGDCIDYVACDNADNDNDTCWACNNNMSGCNSANGCAFNEQKMECIKTPSYSSDCSVFDGFSELCTDQINCSYNILQKYCISTSRVPVQTGDCSVQNGFKTVCEDNDDCLYNSTTNECNDIEQENYYESQQSCQLSISLILAFILALLF